MFVDLLVQGFHIDYDDIFCTSMDKALRVGEDFIKSIKENLLDSEIVLFLITQNFVLWKWERHGHLKIIFSQLLYHH